MRRRLNGDNSTSVVQFLFLLFLFQDEEEKISIQLKKDRTRRRRRKKERIAESRRIRRTIMAKMKERRKNVNNKENGEE